VVSSKAWHLLKCCDLCHRGPSASSTRCLAACMPPLHVLQLTCWVVRSSSQPPSSSVTFAAGSLAVQNVRSCSSRAGAAAAAAVAVPRCETCPAGRGALRAKQVFTYSPHACNPLSLHACGSAPGVSTAQAYLNTATGETVQRLHTIKIHQVTPQLL
jgi:hypothetical protein